jgi:hypothetical protein
MSEHDAVRTQLEDARRRVRAEDRGDLRQTMTALAAPSSWRRRSARADS